MCVGSGGGEAWPGLPFSCYCHRSSEAVRWVALGSTCISTWRSQQRANCLFSRELNRTEEYMASLHDVNS